MDVHTPEQRSRNMAAIRSKNTKPELYLRKLLFSRGYRYRLYNSKIPGKPDLWLAKYRTALFVHGCFWHRHQGCKYASVPANNREFWEKKFSSNIVRDREVQKKLLESGIRVLIIWECTVKRMMKDEIFKQDTLLEIESFLSGSRKLLEL